MAGGVEAQLLLEAGGVERIDLAVVDHVESLEDQNRDGAAAGDVGLAVMDPRRT